MAISKDVRHPKGKDSVTPQTEGGKHPRDVDAKNYERPQGSPPPPGKPGRPSPYGAGKHYKDQARSGRKDDEVERPSSAEDDDWRNK